MRTARKQPCVKKQHVWTLDRGRRCAVCDARRTRLPGTPKLMRLAYGSVYCELCRVNIGRGSRSPGGGSPTRRRGVAVPRVLRRLQSRERRARPPAALTASRPVARPGALSGRRALAAGYGGPCDASATGGAGRRCTHQIKRARARHRRIPIPGLRLVLVGLRRVQDRGPAHAGPPAASWNALASVEVRPVTRLAAVVRPARAVVAVARRAAVVTAIVRASHTRD